MKLKNIFSITLLCLCCVLVACTQERFTRGGISYQKCDGGVEVIPLSVRQYLGVVRVPDTVVYKGEFYPVVAIGDGAFANCKMLTQVTLPPTIQRIGKGAFRNCRGLKGIHCQVGHPLAVDSLTFAGISREQCRLYVPVEAGQRYAKAAHWGTFEVYGEGRIYKESETIQ